MSRPDRARWGAYGAAACAAAYGSMKLAQALGANALADKDPLPPEMRERLLARDPLFVASHWALATAAVVGVVVALATLRPWRAALPRRLLLAIAWTLGVFMIARSIGVLGFGFVGDTLLLAGVRPPPAGHAVLARELARWDLLLWSPFFLLWGVCWTAAGWRLHRRSTVNGGPASAVDAASPTISP
ncbi:DUF3995 domain-containing protein [Micromonospora sp. NPDC023814]|uniref:DUF3995 domain-containing protein n=1 Tax=Micromonospora sp. NPDC023814 TaxID=3154596 RepID=UPI0033D1973F